MNKVQKRRMLRRYAVRTATLFLTVVLMKTIISGKSIQANEEIVHLPREVTFTEYASPTISLDVGHPVEKIMAMVPEDNDRYLLAKIAMAEAEGEDIEGKAHVIRVVLNRVSDYRFPNDVESVIFEHSNNVWQFSSLVPEGRWYTTEPNEECYEAVRMVLNDEWNESQNALYFESKSKSEWHSNNLEYLFKHGNHYFYTEKGQK